MTLDQPWNHKLQANFENYLECRPVTVDELKTHIAAEIDCSNGRRRDNPYWWRTFAADNKFTFARPPAIAAPKPANVPAPTPQTPVARPTPQRPAPSPLYTPVNHRIVSRSRLEPLAEEESGSQGSREKPVRRSVSSPSNICKRKMFSCQYFTCLIL